MSLESIFDLCQKNNKVERGPMRDFVLGERCGGLGGHVVEGIQSHTIVVCVTQECR